MDVFRTLARGYLYWIPKGFSHDSAEFSWSPLIVEATKEWHYSRESCDKPKHMSLCNLKETLRSRFIDVHLNVQMHIGWSLFLDILWLINSMDMELIVGFFTLETSWRKHCYSAWSPDCRSISCNVRPSSKGFPGRMGDSWIFDLQFGQNVVFPQALSNLPSSPVVLNANQTTHPIGRRGTFANKQHLLPWNRHFLIHKVFDLCHGVLPNVLEVVLGWKAMECSKAWDVEAMIQHDHFKDSERGLCPSLTSMKQLPAAIKYLFHLLQIYIPFHEVLEPSTNGKPM